MSAQSHQRITRRRITVALENHLHENSAASVACYVDCSPSQVHRRGGTLAHWPLSDVLGIAENDPEVRETLIDALQGPGAPPPDPARAITDFHDVLEDAAELMQTGLEIVRDGRFDAKDKPAARKLRYCIRDLVPLLKRLDQHCSSLEAQA